MLGTPEAKASYLTVEKHKILQAPIGSVRKCSCGQELRSNGDVSRHVIDQYEEVRSRLEYEKTRLASEALPDPPDLIVL